MSRLVLIGNAPSSGSTFLAELLDSTPYSACGPELNLFAISSLYAKHGSSFHTSLCSSSPSLYITRNPVAKSSLSAYGFDSSSFDIFLQSHKQLDSLMNDFASRFLALRGKPQSGVVFEKTPQNINTIGEYLDAVEDARFVTIVRNPVYVYASLLCRGFPRFIALFVWLIDVAFYLPFMNDERVLLLHYEDLVRDPVAMVRKVLHHSYGEVVEINTDDFISAYENNLYLSYFGKRLNSWSVKKTGIFANANEAELPQAIWEDFAAALNMSIHGDYAELFNIQQVRYVDAVAQLGYSDVLEYAEKVTPDLSVCTPDGAAKRILLKKMLYYLYDQKKIHLASSILNPVTRC